MPHDDDSSPRRVTGLVGTVVRAPMGTGSKSERAAMWLEASEGRFVLRRKEGPTFGDRELLRFVGKKVMCAGVIVGYALLAESIEVVK